MTNTINNSLSSFVGQRFQRIHEIFTEQRPSRCHSIILWISLRFYPRLCFNGLTKFTGRVFFCPQFHHIWWSETFFLYFIICWVFPLVFTFLLTGVYIHSDFIKFYWHEHFNSEVPEFATNPLRHGGRKDILNHKRMN